MSSKFLRFVSILFDLILQGAVACLILFPLVSENRVTFDSARLITVGMSPSDVESILGEPYALAGCVFTPIAVIREDGEPKVDGLMVTPSFYPLGPGLPSYTLHSRQEEFPSYFGQTLPSNRCQFWLTKSCSIVVFYDQGDRVAKVFALPTTVKPGDPVVRLKWFVSELFRKLF